MSVDIKVDFNYPKILQKVTGHELGTFVATEWKKLINPYTPYDTGRTQNTAEISPWHIRYNPVDPEKGTHYAQKIYYGENIKFKKIHNPYATHHWDRAAEQAGQKETLYKKVNEYLHK